MSRFRLKDISTNFYGKDLRTGAQGFLLGEKVSTGWREIDNGILKDYSEGLCCIISRNNVFRYGTMPSEWWQMLFMEQNRVRGPTFRVHMITL